MILKSAIKRFLKQDGIDSASILSFSTLLALVPTLSLALSIFSVSPYFKEIEVKFEQFLFEHLLPENHELVQGYLQQFIEQTSQLASISMIFLAISALLLFYEIDKKINSIWQKDYRRNLVASFGSYFLILFLGPLLLGASLLLGSYLNYVNFSSDSILVNNLISIIMTSFGFTFFYYFTPTAVVTIKNSFKSALIISFLLEILKVAISYYFAAFPSYKIIYGTFAVIPLFMLWIFTIWIVVLFGASLCYCFNEKEIKNNK